MSAGWDEDERSERPIEDESGEDDTYARRLFESGDMGLRPGQHYPPFLGNSEYAQRWRAIMGSSEEEHVRGLERQAQRDNPDRYIRKLWRRPRTSVAYQSERLIGVDQFREAYSAVAYANSQGAILNTHITLTWPLLGYEEHTAASAALQSGLIKHMREWFRHKADPLERPFAWMYVHECSGSTGFHTHFLVFIPLEWRAEFKVWLDQRLTRLSRQRPRPKGAVHLSPARADRALMHQWRQFGYLMKSVDPRESLPVFPGSAITVPLTDLVEWAHEGPGEVKCKLRIGIANEIRASARAGDQYRSLLDCGITDVRLLFGNYDYAGWEWAQQEAQIGEFPATDSTKLSMLAVQSERAQADEEFERRYAAWLETVQQCDERFRESTRGTAAQFAAITKLFGGSEV
jgi:hypothetical protein